MAKETMKNPGFNVFFSLHVVCNFLCNVPTQSEPDAMYPTCKNKVSIGYVVAIIGFNDAYNHIINTLSSNYVDILNT